MNATEKYGEEWWEGMDASSKLLIRVNPRLSVAFLAVAFRPWLEESMS